MAVGEDWSLQEIQATVLDYMAMWRLELAGQAYNKTTHRRSLLVKLSGRSEAAIELKHQNISAVLRDLGHFWIPGYKPRSNYQHRLAEEVESWIAANPEIDRYASAAAEAPAVVPEHFDFLGFQVAAPVVIGAVEPAVRESQAPYGEQRRLGLRRDYAAREAQNSSLGRAGEELVVNFEKYRLAKAGYEKLAEKVEHVAQTQGDGLGFDVLSFDDEGKERFIEVKTTTFAQETPFFASASEVRFAEKNATQFALYRLFDFRKAAKCFTLLGPIQNYCSLDPFSYRCSFR